MKKILLALGLISGAFALGSLTLTDAVPSPFPTRAVESSAGALEAVSGTPAQATDSSVPATNSSASDTSSSALPSRPSKTALGSPKTGVQYEWPSGQQVTVLRPFSPGPKNWLPGHRGVDLALASDQPVFAAADGRVLYAGQLNDRELVSIEHADGIRTTYEPLRPVVARGDVVSRGDLVGYVSGHHCAPSACLHWGAKRGSDDYVDPLSLLVRGPIRLYE